MSNIASQTGIPVPAIAAVQPASRTYHLTYDPGIRVTVIVTYNDESKETMVDAPIVSTDVKAAIVELLNEKALDVRSDRRKERLEKIASAISKTAPLPWLSHLPQELIIQGQCTQETMRFELASDSPSYAFQGTGSEACDTRAFTAETKLWANGGPVSFCQGALAGAEPPDPDTLTPGRFDIFAELSLDHGTAEDDPAEPVAVAVTVTLHTTFRAGFPEPETEA